MVSLDIRIDLHTRERALERGATEEEIREVLESGTVLGAKRGRLRKAKVFSFGLERLGAVYKQKRVELIYTGEDGTLVTITVYVFYGEWGNGR